jgi:citrate synthase
MHIGCGNFLGLGTSPREHPSNEFATLTLPDGQEHCVKVLRPTLGDDVFLDIRDLHAKLGCFVFDPGYTCTGSCMSAITYIDGPKGVCLYRGYPVQDLCDKARALEVAYLLLVGELPDDEQLHAFQREVKGHMIVHKKVTSLYSNFTLNAHPMAIMVAVVGALSCIYSELDCHNAAHRWLACTRLIAQLPTLACMAYKTSIGQPIMDPKSTLTFAENFLYMMFATPMEPYEVNPVAAKAINTFMILHMDHEQNASTSTVRIAGSSQANPYACIAAGIASLWGAAHGGANEAVITMLQGIGSADKVPQFVADVKAKVAGVRLMGFGHRVYKNYDPRARVMKRLVQEVLKGLNIKDPLLEVAQRLEEVALKDSYFVQRKLYPNVDYYSGIMLRALGIPTSMFTVMFAMSRTVGWVSQWKEMLSEGQLRIGRPRQMYVGVKPREYQRRDPTPCTPVRNVSKHSFSQEQAREEESDGTKLVGSYKARRSSSFQVNLPTTTLLR